MVSEHTKKLSTFTQSLKREFDSMLQYSLELSMEKGVSTWVSALRLKSHGLYLHKSAFWDATHLRYVWTLLIFHLHVYVAILSL